MAKITGPLHSDSARGQFGKVMVFSSWKGIASARKYVVPANTMTGPQGDVRLVMGGVGQAIRCVGLADSTHTDSLYAADAKLCNPTGQSWGSYLVQYVIKNIVPDATAFEALYTEFDGHTAKAQFTTDAGLLELADFDVSYKDTTHAFSKGMQLYALAKYATAMKVLKVGVFDRAPYTTALASWDSGKVDDFKDDLLAVSI